MSYYKPTGYKPGRPRAGEVRPPNKHARAMALYRKRRLEREPEWLDQLAERQRALYWKNPEKAREQTAASAKRMRAWKKANAADIMSQQIDNVFIDVYEIL